MHEASLDPRPCALLADLTDSSRTASLNLGVAMRAPDACAHIARASVEVPGACSRIFNASGGMQCASEACLYRAGAPRFSSRRRGLGASRLGARLEQRAPARGQALVRVVREQREHRAREREHAPVPTARLHGRHEQNVLESSAGNVLQTCKLFASTPCERLSNTYSPHIAVDPGW